MKVSGGRLVGHVVQHKVLTLSAPLLSSLPSVILSFNLPFFLFVFLLSPTPSFLSRLCPPSSISSLSCYPLTLLSLASLSILSISSLSPLSSSSSPPCCLLALPKINALSVCVRVCVWWWVQISHWKLRCVSSVVCVCLCVFNRVWQLTHDSQPTAVVDVCARGQTVGFFAALLFSASKFKGIFHHTAFIQKRLIDFLCLKLQ